MGAVLPRTELAEIVALRQAAGERAVLTNGIFDLLHLGHAQYLRRARFLGDFLVLGLNSDESTRRLKGPRRPLVPEGERAELVAALACVDYVTIFAETTADDLLIALKPAVYAKGGDYAGEGTGAGDVLVGPTELRSLLAGKLTGKLTGEGPQSAMLAGLVERLPETATVAACGCALALLAYLPGHSTTALIERIVARYDLPPQLPSRVREGGGEERRDE
jgi:D-beta-D-heptose 7-phosphate kinase/D-beta-D-heptose 1-phosphate adenosyltransferase